MPSPGQSTSTLLRVSLLTSVLGLKDGSTVRQDVGDLAAQLIASPEMAAVIGNSALFQGEWDASGGTFPSGAAKGQFWRVSGADTVDGVAFSLSDVLLALVDDASTTTYEGNWHRAGHASFSHTHGISDVTGLADVAASGDSDDLTEGAANLLLTVAERAKLTGIEAGATADQTGAQIKAAYEAEADTNAFTDAEKTKLTGIEAGATADQTGAQIKAAYEAEADTNAFTDDEKTKLTGVETGATADQTGAEIKAAYEAEDDTNAFTNADKAKLDGIETDATADQTGAEIKAAYEAEADTNAFTDAEKTKLTGIETGATADQSGAEIKAAYEAEADTNAYTDDEKAKLAGLVKASDFDRPGEHPDAFSATYTGEGADRTPLTGGVVVSGAGLAYVQAGAGIVAARYPVALANDVIEITARFRRTSNPSDPNNHSILLRAAWLNEDKNLVSVQTLATVTDALTSSGLIERSARVSSLAVDDVTAPPAGAVYVCAFVETFGGDGTTAVETLRCREITDLHLLEASSLADVATSGNSDDLTEGTTKLLMTVAEREKLASVDADANAGMTGAQIKTAYEAEDDTNAYTDAEKTKLAGLVKAPYFDRPGDNPDAFSATYIGEGATKTPLTGGVVVSGAGLAYVQAGAGVVSARYPVALNSDVIEITARFRRTSNPSDPNNHAILLRAAWLDKDKALIGNLETLATLDDALTSSGLIERSARVSSLAVDGVTAPPTGALYVCPFVETFGEDGTTAVEVLRCKEITDLHLVETADLSAVVAAAQAATAAANAASLTATETLDTMADVGSFDRPADVGTITLKGGYSAYDGLGGQWVYDPSDSTSSADLPDILVGNDGARYKRAMALDGRLFPEQMAAAADLEVTLDGTGYTRDSGSNDHAAFMKANDRAAALGVPLVMTGNYYIKTYFMARGDGATGTWATGLDVEDKTRLQVYIIDRTDTAGEEGEISPLSAVTVVDLADITTDSVGNITYSGTALTTDEEIYVAAPIKPKGIWDWGAAMLWLEIGPFEVGFWYDQSRVCCTGFARIIHQYRRDLSDGANNIEKPPHSGHIGNVLFFGDGYLKPETHSRVHGVEVDALLCRAANTGSQVSHPSMTHNFIGYVSGCKLRIGGHGVSNVEWDAPGQEHWGGKTDGGVWPIEDMTQFAVLETYRPHNIDVEFVNRFDGHPMLESYVLSASSGGRLSGVDFDGVPRMRFLVGDEANENIVAAQEGVQLDRKKIDFVRLTGASPESTSESVVTVAGRGTDKQDDFPGGTGIKKIRYAENPLDFEGFYIRSDDEVRSGIRCFGVNGHLNLGVVDVDGCRKSSVEIEDSLGDIEVRLRHGTATARVEYAQGVKFHELGVDLGTEAAPDGTGAAKLGYQAANTLLTVLGETITTTTAADVEDGDEQTEIVAIAKEIQKGALVQIGTGFVTATEFLDNGATILKHTPISLDSTLSSGATVTVDRRARVDKCVVTGGSSEYGIEVNGGDIFGLDMTRLKFAGRNALRLESDARAVLVGTMPVTVGRVDQDGSVFTVRVRPGCHATCQGMVIPKPDTTRVSHHFQCARTSASGPFGTATFVGCMIEDIDTLVSANSLYDQAFLYGCVDFQGNILPERIGANVDWTPAITIDNSTTGIAQTSTGYCYIDGDFVEIRATITLTDKGDLEGTVLLPLPISGISGDDTLAVSMEGVTFATGEGPGAYVDGNTVRFIQQGSEGNPSMNELQLTDDTVITVSGRYRRR